MYIRPSQLKQNYNHGQLPQWPRYKTIISEGMGGAGVRLMFTGFKLPHAVALRKRKNRC